MDKNKAYATPEPNFSRFDGLSPAERVLARNAAAREHLRQRRRRWALGSLAVGVVMTVAAGVFLRWPRVDGYVNMAPLTVVSVQGERAAFRIDDAQLAALLGQEVITVPYLLEGMAPAELFRYSSRGLLRGETEQSCQLLVHLTNGDLLRLRVNPFKTFAEKDHLGRNDWIVSILRAVFEGGASDDALLSLRYFVSKEPLLWYAE